MNKGCAISYCLNTPRYEIQVKSKPQVCRNHLSKLIEESQDGSGKAVVQVIDRSPEYLKGFEAGLKAAQRAEREEDLT